MVDTIRENPITTIIFIIVMIGSVVSTIKMFADSSLEERILSIELEMQRCSKKIDIQAYQIDQLGRDISSLTKEIDRLRNRLEACNGIHGDDDSNGCSASGGFAYFRHSDPNEPVVE